MGNWKIRTTWSALAVGVLCLGCGSSSKPAPDVASALCSPSTCASLGLHCGDADDGCGGALHCGTCSSSSCVPKTCRDSQVWCGDTSDGCGNLLHCGDCADNELCAVTPVGQTCVERACGSAACRAQFKSCGSVIDDCGESVECGTCSGGEVCNDGICGPWSSCAPTTCAANRQACGTMSDGCGHQISCGTCGSGTTCTTDGACALTSPSEPAAEWVVTAPRPFEGIDADSSGDVFAILADYQYPSQVRRYSADGQQRWSVTADARTTFSVVEASPAADAIVLSGWVDGISGPGGGVVAQYTKSGASVGAINHCNDEHSISVLDVSAAGDVVGMTTAPTNYLWSILVPNGPTFDPSGSSKVDVWAAAFTPEGNIVAVGGVRDVIMIENHSFGTNGKTRPGVFEFSRTGHLLWGDVLNGEGVAWSVGVTSLGSVVALVKHDTSLTFGGQTLPGGRGWSMVVLEANGDERVGVRVADTVPSWVRLEVDPVGRAFVITSPNCSGSEVTKYDLNGAKEWELAVPGSLCWNSDRINGVALSDHHLVLSGQFTVPTDFGDGVKTPIGNVPNGFLLKLNR